MLARDPEKVAGRLKWRAFEAVLSFFADNRFMWKIPLH
jgi:hypothetical protein